MSFINLCFLLILWSCGNSSSTPSPRDTTAQWNLLKGELPGLAGGVFINGEEKQMVIMGARKAGEATPLSLEDPFHLGSCTKALTSTLAAVMVEAQLLQWDSPLSELLPELKLHPDYHQVTFDMLLVHESGLRKDTEGFEGNWLYRTLQHMDSSPQEGRKLLASTLLELPATHAGNEFHYSNAGYIVAAHILERLTGKSWEELLQENIFTPLKMKSCGVGVSPVGPWGHIPSAGQYLPLRFDNPSAFAPSASVHCALADWQKFLQMQLDGTKGRSRFLAPNSFKKLFSTARSDTGNYTYGGWIRAARAWAGGVTFTHSGSNTLNFATAWIAPEKNAILLGVANAGGNEAAVAVDNLIRTLKDQTLK